MVGNCVTDEHLGAEKRDRVQNRRWPDHGLAPKLIPLHNRILAEVKHVQLILAAVKGRYCRQWVRC